MRRASFQAVSPAGLVVDSFDGNAYRTVYVVSSGKALYVLHAFMKKSKSGIA